MQYNVTTVPEYLAALEEDWRKQTLEEIRSLIKEAGPDIEEYIQYKMLAYGDGKTPLFHLNAQKNYVSLYIGDTKKVDPEEEFLAGLDKGKGCIRFKKSTVVQETRIRAFIERTIGLWRDGVDVGC